MVNHRRKKIRKGEQRKGEQGKIKNKKKEKKTRSLTRSSQFQKISQMFSFVHAGAICRKTRCLWKERYAVMLQMPF